jgi:hypothetical protein
MQGSIYRRVTWIAILAIGLVGAIRTFGQGTSASLSGQVLDTTGAAIPGATLTLRNTDTNLSLTATSNGQGTYQIQPVPPGKYTLTVEMTGFVHYSQEGIVLAADISATQNVTLKAGSAEQTVTVTAGTELINTTSAELGTSVNALAVTQLPLNGRDPSSLVLLAPGTTNIAGGAGGQPGIQTGFSFPTETGASANGGRQGSTYYLLDGVPNMDNYTLLTAPFPNADATQEFRVITNNFNALYGFAPGAVVSIQTKSGTNQFHGGAFEFLRNQDFNASAGYFSHTNSPDPLKRNQFGGYIGGPILKNRFFFFANYQGTRASSAALSNSTQTPTAAMLNGDFSGITTTLCSGNTAPAGCPFKTVNGVPNQVDPTLFNPASVTITKTGLPLGQGPDGRVFYTGGPVVTNYNEGTARLDFNISQSQRLDIRSFVDDLIEPSGDVPGNMLSVLTLNPWSETFAEKMQFFNEALGHTWTVNPTMVNSVSVFWNQMSAHNSAAVRDINGDDICWSRYINVNEVPGQCWMEGLSVGNGGFNGGWTEPSQEVRTTYGIYDNLTKTIGNHTISAGLNVQHQYAKEFTLYPTVPIIGFGGSYTGNGLADFLLGYMSSYEQGAGEIAAVSGWQPGFYGQDAYHVRPNVTVTLGLRWDPNIAPGVAGGRGSAYVPGQQSTLYPNSPLGLVFPGDKGISSGLMPNSYGYWEPRIGIAYQPPMFPHTSIRAGFGLFTAPLQYSFYNHTADIAPFSPTFNLNGTFSPAPNVPLSLSDPWSQNAGTNFVSPFPPFASTSVKPPASSTFAPPFEIPAIFAQNFKLGITQSWNASVEQQIGKYMVFRLAYVGSESYHQSLIIDQNPGIYSAGAVRANGDFTSILTNFSNGTDSYNSLQATLERHFADGFQFQSNFTWSRNIDTASSGNISFGTNQLPDPFDLRYNRGVSALNVPLIWVTNFVYQSPALRGKSLWLQEVAGNWQIGAIITAQSGFPFGISPPNNNASGALQYEDRANLVPDQPLGVRTGGKANWLNHYFNAAAFTQNPPGTFGSSGKNLIQGPPVTTVDMNLSKTWNFTEKYQLQFRWEMFNALNHPSFGTPGTTVGQGSFGQITSLGPVPPRVGQAALKFTF